MEVRDIKQLAQDPMAVTALQNESQLVRLQSLIFLQIKYTTVPILVLNQDVNCEEYTNFLPLIIKVLKFREMIEFLENITWSRSRLSL